MEQELFRMFGKTSKIRRTYDTYNKSPTLPPFSIHDLTKIISKEVKKQICIKEINRPWKPKHFKGQLFKKKDSADIVVPKVKTNTDPNGVTLCERNFAVIKEACHLLIDDADAVVDQLEKLIENIVTAGDRVVLDDHSPIIKSEYLGEFAARELLFPVGYRDSCINEIAEEKATPLDIAKRFMIPEQQVIKALTLETHCQLERYRDKWMEVLDDYTAGQELTYVDMN